MIEEPVLLSKKKRKEQKIKKTGSWFSYCSSGNAMSWKQKAIHIM
jgi:hypothetical protein